MKFKVDENLPIEVAGSLRQAGYDAATVSEQHLVIPLLSSEPLEHLLWIVDETHIRIRG